MFGSRKRKLAAQQAALVTQVTEDVIAKVEAKEVIMDRKGVFTPAQEEILDKLYAATGIMETVDGMIIRTVDNVLIEKLKRKLPPEYLPTLYEIIDNIMDSLASNLK